MRHITFSFTTKDNKGVYFIKKQSTFKSNLNNEVLFYNFIWSTNQFHELQNFIPKFYLYDSNYKMLVLENLHA